MALGTPVAAAAAYSAAAGTTVAPAYPTGITAGDVLVLFVGMKPSTANSGTVTTPTGWTLRDSLTAAGGYGTTIGADTGNTNLYVYTKDTVTGSETGTLSVTLGTNNVTWAFIVRIPDGGGTISYGSADGQRTTTPTSPMSIALTNGATATNFQAGDIAIWAMCIPTDVTTPSQFSAQSITATGATFGTAAELNEPDSTTGNDIGGYSAWASVTAGSSTTAPTVTTTLGGTLTNVRGPVVLLRVRETVVNVTHDTSGALTGQIGSVSGTAQHNIPHATSGVLAGQTATITGDADREAAVIPHTTDGALVGPGATITGAATRFRAHATSGALPGQTATITGDADHEELIIPHVTSGAIVGPGSTLEGSAFVSHLHATTGALGGSAATLAGSAARASAAVTHATTGGLEGPGALMAGEASRTSAQPVLPPGGGGSGPWSKKELRKRDSKLDAEKQERQALRELVAQAIEPVKAAAPETVQVVTSAKAGVTLLLSTGPAVALPALPQFDAAAVARKVQRALQEAGIAVQRVRQTQARRAAAEVLEAARRENERRLRKRRRDEEILLLM